MIPDLKGRQQVTLETIVVRVRKVLVVDEALPVRRALLDALHKLGIPACDVLGAADAEAALEAFARENPAIVFTEFVGDDPNAGLEMVLEMLALDPHARVVLVTAEPLHSPIVRRAVREGVFAVIEKPLRHEKIRQALSEIENEAGGIERYR